MSLASSTINIMGDYWDSYIFNENLFLWSMSGELIVIDWHKINLEYLNNFKNSDDVFIDKKNLENYIKFKYDNPFKNRQTDVDFLNNKMYGITSKGLFQVDIDLDKGIKLKNDSKLWDERLLSIKAKKNGRIALSAGEEGLYEFDENLKYANINKMQFKNIENKNIFKISNEISSSSFWMFSSIYSSSLKGRSYMAGFSWENNKVKFQNIISEDTIFKGGAREGFSWGAGNKIYRLADYGVEYVEFTQSYLSNLNSRSPFSEIKKIRFQPWKGRPLNAKVARFGVIIECENAIVIMFNDREYKNISDEIIHWRVFTSDEIYSNQLHTILEDRIKIYSFDVTSLENYESNKRFSNKYLWQ